MNCSSLTWVNIERKSTTECWFALWGEWGIWYVSLTLCWLMNWFSYIMEILDFKNRLIYFQRLLEVILENAVLFFSDEHDHLSRFVNSRNKRHCSAINAERYCFIWKYDFLTFQAVCRTIPWIYIDLCVKFLKCFYDKHFKNLMRPVTGSRAKLL